MLMSVSMVLAGCESDYAGSTADEEGSAMKMVVNVNGMEFRATLENNDAADALAGMLNDGPLSIMLRDYGGFEKGGSLGRSLPASDRRITANAGDIVLYQGSQIVMFYGSNTWSYTMLGHIDDLSGWEAALGSDDAAVIFSMER